MARLLILLIALCISTIRALPKPVTQLNGRVGGGIIAETAPHACMILVNRANLDGTNTAALGGGSIISTKHVVTAAHLVQGDNISYQIGFIVGTSRRLYTSTFRVIHEDYSNDDFSNDIALIYLQGTNTFPATNVIAITTDTAAPAEGTALITAGFGFTSADSTGATSDPYAADQHVSSSCTFVIGITSLVAIPPVSPTHFCAEDSSAGSWVCPGDNGAGAFEAGATTAENILVGIVSRVLGGCASSQPTGYTIVANYVDWIKNLAGI